MDTDARVSEGIQFAPLTAVIGAEVTGCELDIPLQLETAEAIYQGLLDYSVLVFRNQRLSPAAQIALAESIGPVMPHHPFFPSIDGYLPVAVIEDNSHSAPENECWHSDMSPMEVPPYGSVLRAVELPDVGGDTLWCSMYAIYDALPKATRARIEGLFAVHDMQRGYASIVDNGKSDTRGDVLSEWGANAGYQQFHRLAFEHPATHRKLIYANGSYTSHINAIDAAESDAILAEIYALISQPKFQLRVRWTPDTVVLWDNWATQHYAVGDHFPNRRVMHRVTIAQNYRSPYGPVHRNGTASNPDVTT